MPGTFVSIPPTDEPRPPSVAAYFAARLGRPLADPQTPKRGAPPSFSPYHPHFHIETGCGVKCKAAIDACAAFVEHVREAFGPDSDDEFKAVEICASVVLCYVYG